MRAPEITLQDLFKRQVRTGARIVAAEILRDERKHLSPIGADEEQTRAAIQVSVTYGKEPRRNDPSQNMRK